MKLIDIINLNESIGKNVPHEIKQLIPDILQIAQSVYDDWDESEEYAGGGICHLIADEISAIFNNHGFESTTVSAQIGEQHVWCVVYWQFEEDDEQISQIYEVDISPYVYEQGGGYSWQKIPNVKFTEDDLEIHLVCQGNHCYDNYFGDF